MFDTDCTRQEIAFKGVCIETPLGEMIAIADDQALHFLEFSDRRGFAKDVAQFKKQRKTLLVEGVNEPLVSIQRELAAYFAGTLKEFTTPVCLEGTPFQKQVWLALQTIPYGQTISYRQLAIQCERPLACRAVGSANGKNRLVLIFPCHRVINADQGLGGYGAGLERKRWLLEHEA